MFDNIGGKIKGLAKFFCWLGIIASVIGGIAIIVAGAQMNSYYYSYSSSVITTAILSGIAVMVFGSLISWIGSFLLYGFGQLVDNSDKLVKMKSNNP